MFKCNAYIPGISRKNFHAIGNHTTTHATNSLRPRRAGSSNSFRGRRAPGVGAPPPRAPCAVRRAPRKRGGTLIALRPLWTLRTPKSPSAAALFASHAGRPVTSVRAMRQASTRHAGAVKRSPCRPDRIRMAGASVGEGRTVGVPAGDAPGRNQRAGRRGLQQSVRPLAR